MFNTIGSTLSQARYGLGAWLLGGVTLNGYSEHDSARLNPIVWDQVDSRMRRYAINEGFYTNLIFNNRLLFDSLLQSRPKKPYKFTRGLRNPVARLIELQTSKVYGAELDFQHAASGAVPVVDADDALRRAIVRVWIHSNWAQEKTQYPKLGAIFGDAFLKIVDDPRKRKVRLEVIDPRKVVGLRVNEYGDVKSYVIQYERLDEETGKTYTYREEADDSETRTYRNGELYALYEDSSGQKVSRWPNEYGFCPFVLTPHEKTAQTFGDTSFSNLIDKIIEICSQQSLLDDAVSKGVNPMLAFGGLQRDDVKIDITKDDTVPMIYLGERGTVTTIGTLIDVAAVSAHIMELRKEIEDDLPELSLHRLREGGNATAPGVRAAYNDASARLTKIQSNYDAGLIKAHQMAVAIGGYRGYDDFQGFGLDSYMRGDLDHSIRPRAIVDDEIDKTIKLQTLQSGGHTELYLRALGYDDETIEKELGRKDEAQRNAIRGLTEGAFGTNDAHYDQQEEDDDDTAETQEVPTAA